MTTLVVGTNDTADKTGDLIITFVDTANGAGITTDGSRTALPGAAIGCYLAAPSISPQPGCAVTLTAPPVAAAVGYNTLTFGPAVQPLGTALWTFSFFGTVPGTPTQNADGSITITTPSTGYGADLCTASVVGGSPPWTQFNGIAFGGGCYAEAVMSQIGGNVNPGMSFWLNDIESMNSASDGTGKQWPGQAAGYGNWIEVDIAEFDASGTQYGLGNHNWYGVGGQNPQPDVNTGGYPGWISPVDAGAGVDFSKPHRYGWLWVPATGAATQTNVLPNSAESGAAVGTPGTTPTGWDFTHTAGLNTQVVGTGTSGGNPYFDFRIFGAVTGGDINLYFCPISGISATPNATYTISVGLAIVAGTLPSGGAFLAADNLTSTGGYIGNAVTSNLSLSGTLTNYTAGFVAAGSVGNVNPRVGIYGPAPGTSVDVTIRILFPQLLLTNPAGGQGYQKFFFDGRQVGSTLFWNKWTSTELPPPQQGTTAYNVIDTRHVAFIFGCGNSARQVTVYSLTVYQADTSHNLGTGATSAGSASGTQWESCSLIWAPPPHAATLWTAGGAFPGSGAIVANPKFPATSWPVAGRLDAVSAIGAGGPRTVAAVSGGLGATSGLSGPLQITAVAAATAAAAGGIIGGATGPGIAAWLVSGVLGAAAGMSARAQIMPALAATTAPSAGIIGAALATSHNQYNLGIGTLAAAAGISADCRIGHQYAVSSRLGAVTGVIPFGGNAPLRVTNYVRNPRPEGIAAGTPGSLPPEWYINLITSGSFTQTIVGTGTEGGIPYTDLQFSGTATGGAGGDFVDIQPDQEVLATQGRTWSFGVFLRLIAGTLPGNVWLSFLSGQGGSLLNQYTSPSAITPTGAALASQWFHYDGVLMNDAGMDNIASEIIFGCNPGAFNFTIRIGGARVEQATASSGPQYLVVPELGTVPGLGGTTSFVY